jgi:hypothetical protein
MEIDMDSPTESQLAEGTDMDPNTIKLYAQGNEMIRVARDGFYVRGVKVPQDDNEALAVYNAFKQWMAWSSLQGRY